MKVQALILSFNEGFAQATLVFLTAFVLLLLLKKPKRGASAAGAH